MVFITGLLCSCFPRVRFLSDLGCAGVELLRDALEFVDHRALPVFDDRLCTVDLEGLPRWTPYVKYCCETIAVCPAAFGWNDVVNIMTIEAPRFTLSSFPRASLRRKRADQGM